MRTKTNLEAKIQYKLLRYILICSTFFTFLGTLFQLYLDYRKDINDVENTLEQIEKVYANSLANSLWHLDNDQLKIQMSGILKLQDIEFIEINEIRDGKSLSYIKDGEESIENQISKTIPLRYSESKVENIIGSLTVKANLAYIYERLWDRILIILVTQTIKTFIVSLCILFIIYVIVAKKIIKIADYTAQLGPQNLDTPLRIPKLEIKNDEIDVLVNSINNLRVNLKDYINKRNEAESQLQDYKVHLEDLVQKRTKQLHSKNQILQEKIEEINSMHDKLVSQEKLASLGSLTSGIAHELNNPLNFIINFADANYDTITDIKEGLKDVQLEADKKELLDEDLDDALEMTREIKEHGKRAEGIIKSMLQHSRGGDHKFSKGNLNDIIQESTNFAFHATRAKYDNFTASINKNLDNDIPDSEMIKGDISRVFLNIITNAFYSLQKAKQERGRDFKPTLSISSKLENNNAIITLEDNGLGIEEENLKTIFEPFFTTKPAGEGTGLGLSLCYEIISKVHHGSLEAEGEVGKYAKFIITLPVISPQRTDKS